MTKAIPILTANIKRAFVPNQYDNGLSNFIESALRTTEHDYIWINSKSVNIEIDDDYPYDFRKNYDEIEESEEDINLDIQIVFPEIDFQLYLEITLKAENGLIEGKHTFTEEQKADLQQAITNWLQSPTGYIQRTTS